MLFVDNESVYWPINKQLLRLAVSFPMRESWPKNAPLNEAWSLKPSVPST